MSYVLLLDAYCGPIEWGIPSSVNLMVAKTSTDGVALLLQFGMPSMMYLRTDLKFGDSAMKFVESLIQYDMVHDCIGETLCFQIRGENTRRKAVEDYLLAHIDIKMRML